MFLFCFTKILNGAFYMTHTFDSEVSLHYWLLWSTVWRPLWFNHRCLMWRQWLAVTFGGFFCRRRRLSQLGRCCCCGRRRPNLRCAAAAAAALIAAATAFVAANEMRNHVDRHGKDDGCIFFITNCTEGLEKRDMWIEKEKPTTKIFSWKVGLVSAVA